MSKANRGNIYHRTDGRWLVSIGTGLYKPNGKPEVQYRYASTQGEAKQILLELQKEIQGGVEFNKNISVSELIEQFIRIKQDRLKPSTISSYQTNANIHIIPYIGKIMVQRLTAQNIIAMFEAGKPKGYSLFVKIHHVLSGALSMAVEKDIILKNPCLQVRYPKDDTKERRAFTLEEQKVFMKAIENKHYKELFTTYLFTGARLGELIPLQWQDIDFTERSLSITKKAIRLHDPVAHNTQTVVQDFCKTRSSKRAITITSGLAELLKKYKEKQQALAEKNGLPWSEDNIVFPNIRGKMAVSENIAQSFKETVEPIGLGWASIHILRHTYATRCYENDVDIKLLSKQLGHKKVSTTLDIYTSIFKPKALKEIDKLAELDNLL